MMDDAALPGLIGSLYDAAVDRLPLGDVLRDVGAALRSPKIVLESVYTQSRAATVQLAPGWDPAVALRYVQDYVHDDPLIIDAMRRPPGSVFSDTMLPDYRAYERSSVYADIYAPSEAEHVVASFVLGQRGRSLVLAFRRRAAQGAYEDSELRLFGALLPHVVRAFQLRSSLEGARLARDGLGEALSALERAALLVRADGHVVQINEMARRLIAEGDGLALQRGRLCAMKPGDQRVLQGAIYSMAGGQLVETRATGTLRIARPSGRAAYTVRVMPLPARDVWSEGSGGLALVFLQDPEATPWQRATALAACYGLTDSEARLAGAIASGRSLKDYAEAVEITENTARGTLKRIFAKTAARSQADLVRLVLSAAGQDPGDRDEYADLPPAGGHR